jgi:opacity protein-like surface antigen
MRKMILAAAAVASLAVPAVSMADAPNGTYEFKPTDQIAQVGKGNTVAKDSAQITQNGQFVSQQAQSGDRAATVQSLLGH